MVAAPTSPETWKPPSDSKVSLSKADLITLAFLEGSKSGSKVGMAIEAVEVSSHHERSDGRRVSDGRRYQSVHEEKTSRRRRNSRPNSERRKGEREKRSRGDFVQNLPYFIFTILYKKIFSPSPFSPFSPSF